MADPRSIPITNVSKTAYHIDDGAVVFPYVVDANSAVSRFPDEWSLKPWIGERLDRALSARKERRDQEIARAKELGQPVPAPLPEPLQPTPEEQAAIDEHTKAQAAAAARLEEFDRKEAEREKIEAQAAADRALVASPPPPPDPNIRRPFGRKGELTEAERALIAKRQAAAAQQQPAPAAHNPQPDPRMRLPNETQQQFDERMASNNASLATQAD